jgi:outer membrane lipoprotein-sorting protein
MYNLITSLIIIALFLGGCAKSPVVPKRSMVSISSEADYLDFIDTRLNSLETFQGSGKLKITNSRKSDSATSAILIKTPDSLRLESFSILGQAVFFFTSREDSFSIYIPKENKYFKGANTLENIQKVLPLNVSIEEFSSYLVGDFKKNKDDSKVIKFLEDRNIYKIYYQSENKKVLWLDPESLTITRCAVYDSDDELKTIVSYSNFKDIEGLSFPMSISMKFLDLDAKIEVDYDEVTVNNGIKDKLFMLDVPEKAAVIDLDDHEKVFSE